jgi:hypothetical protein
VTHGRAGPSALAPVRRQRGLAHNLICWTASLGLGVGDQQSGQGAFDLPAMAAQPLAGLHSSAGDPRADISPAQDPAAGWVVVLDAARDRWVDWLVQLAVDAVERLFRTGSQDAWVTLHTLEQDLRDARAGASTTTRLLTVPCSCPGPVRPAVRRRRRARGRAGRTAWSPAGPTRDIQGGRRPRPPPPPRTWPSVRSTAVRPGRAGAGRRHLPAGGGAGAACAVHGPLRAGVTSRTLRSSYRSAAGCRHIGLSGGPPGGTNADSAWKPCRSYSRLLRSLVASR